MRRHDAKRNVEETCGSTVVEVSVVLTTWFVRCSRETVPIKEADVSKVQVPSVEE